MGKKLITFVLLICLCMPLFAGLDMSKAEPYKEDEFPKWALDIRRTEVIFMGALPLTFIAANAINSAIGSEMGFFNTLTIAAGVSAAITLADYVIGLFE